MKNYEIVIIGNGILGLSTAFALHLKEPSLKIAIVGPQAMDGAASHVAGAMLGCFGEVTTAIKRCKYNRIKFEMGLKAKKMWPSWLDKINQYSNKDDKLQAKSGTFIINNTESGLLDDENYQFIIETLQKYNEPYDEVSPKTIPGFNPITNHRPTHSIYIPNEGYINSTELIRRLHAWVESCPHIDLINRTAIDIKKSNGSINSVVLEDNTNLSMNHLILAAGAFTSSLLDKLENLNTRIPKLFFGVGNAILIKLNGKSLINNVIRTPNRSFACGLHVLPRDGDTLYSGATNNITMEPEYFPRMGLINFLTRCTLEQVDQNLHGGKITRFEVGHRPVTIDTFPLIGKTSIKGLWLLTGTYRDGLQQSPYLAEQLVNEIFGEKSELISTFKPERFPIQSYTKEEAIEEGIKHYLAGAYEHQLHMPRVGWDEMFKEMIRKKIVEIYNTLPESFVLPPDFLLLFDEKKQNLMSMIQYLKSLTNACLM